MALVDSVYHPLSTDADDWSPSLFVPQRKHFEQRSPLQSCTLARPGNNSATTSGPTFEFSGATRSGEKIFSKQAEGKGTVQGTDSLGRQVEETMRGETERGGSGMTQQGKDAARELGGAAGVAEEDWARIETLLSGPSRVKASTSSLGGDRATSSPSSSRLASPPPMDAIADSYFSTINFGLGPTHAQNGAFHIPPLSRPPSNGKGKDRAHDDSPPFPSDSPGLPPPVHDAHESPYSCLQSASAAPIRFRRVGALGISVSSSSGEPSSNDMRRKGSSQRGWSDEDRRRSAQDRCEWGEGSNGSSGNLDSAGGFANGRVDQPGVSEAGFRGIVDELALQNQQLKARLRRYEAARVPSELKKERLFEVRFFEGMPSDKREEIESFLTRYVQGIGENTNTNSPAMTGALPPIPSPPLESASFYLAGADHRSLLPTPTLFHAHGISAPDQARDMSRTDRLPSPPALRRRHHDKRRRMTDRERLAGPSYSGVEPASLSGTGSGMRISPSSGIEGRKARDTRVKVEASMNPSRAVIGRTEETSNAVDIVDVLETLFEDSLNSGDGQFECDPRAVIGTNEAYLGHLLDDDFLSGGWTYLNLVCTMGQIHRFNVTLPFVQTAIRTFSTKLEVSACGSKVRWVGSRPDRSAIDHMISRAEQPAEYELSGKTTPQGPASIASAPSHSGSASTTITDVLTTGRRLSFFDASLPPGPASTAATSIAAGSSLAPPERVRPSLSVARAASKAETKAAKGKELPARLTRDTSLMESLALSPFGAGEATISTAIKSSYVPFFDRREGGSVPPDIQPGSADDEVPFGDEGRRRKTAEGTGTMVFYSNAQFCSDLSTDVFAGSKESGPAREAVAFGEVLVPGEEETYASTSYLVEEGTSLLEGTLEDVEDIDMVDEGVEDLELDDSNPFDPSKPRVSGMTEVVPADLFIVTVITSHPPQSFAHPALSRKRKIDDPDAAALKGRRASSLAHKVLSTQTVHYPTAAQCHPGVAVGRTTRSSSPSSNGSMTSHNGSMSSRSSIRATLPPLPQRVASPPPADYLLSLAMPFYDWSPAETELAFRRSFLSRSTSAEKSRQEGEARSIADDGESAIGLDDEG